MADLKVGAISVVVQAFRLALVALVTMLAPTRVAAHPVPFSYLDVQLDGAAVNVTLVAHIFDLAHDLNVTPPEELLKSRRRQARAATIATMLTSRFSIAGGRSAADRRWIPIPPILAERQSVRFTARYERRRRRGGC